MARPAIEDQIAIPAGGPSIQPLVLRDLCFSAGGRVLLDRINLVLAAGVRTVMLGPNGAGKSLLLRICHGLISPSSGTVEWMGPGAREARVRQAMVFQRPMLLRRSVFANVDYALAVRRLPKALRTSRAWTALEVTGLAGLAERPAGVLSGGEQQRVALARAWALNPEVLFLDEPTANLDPAATRAVEEAIAGIALGGTKIVMTTHDLGQARRLAEEIVFLHGGRLVERRPAAEFFAEPEHDAARAFLHGELLW
ncbi:MAG: Tungstate uptake system ATP-binding protein TupC [Gammaproteobacteria bacterium]|nr:Tungstate uptake system ATP-binding protein TupC [Gammaproteobacteria bacterium]